MDEIWKDIKGYEGYYQVSNFGRVKSLARYRIGSYGKPQKVYEKILKQTIMNNGYLTVVLSNNKIYKQKLVHRLVAETFILNLENKKEVNHINGDKTNNHVTNLEYVSHHDNQKHASINNLMAVGEKHGRHKLIENDVLEIRKLKGILSYSKISKKYNISIAMISLIINNKNWKHIK